LIGYILRHELHLLKMYLVKDRFTSTLLAVVLILGQLAFVHHALDQSSHTDDEPCKLCLLSAGLDEALEHKNQYIGHKPIRSLAGNWQDLLNLLTVTTAFLARAPPVAPLSV
jgi:hypothetical protein